MLLAACLLLCRQDPPPAPPAQDPPQEDPGMPGAQDEMAKLLRLMEDVREAFRRTDVALQDAQTTADQDTAPSGAVVDKLHGAVGEADQLLDKIEELLSNLHATEQQNPQQNQGGGSGMQQPSQGSPRDSRNQNLPNDNEPQNPNPGGDDQQRLSNTRPPDGLKSPFFYDPRYGAWGELPVRLQSALENATADTLPLRYRRWLEEYYRKSSETAPR